MYSSDLGEILRAKQGKQKIISAFIHKTTYGFTHRMINLAYHWISLNIITFLVNVSMHSISNNIYLPYRVLEDELKIKKKQFLPVYWCEKSQYPHSTFSLFIFRIKMWFQWDCTPLVCAFCICIMHVVGNYGILPTYWIKMWFVPS